MSNNKEYIGFSKSVNDYYNHYVTVADAKAGVLIAISFVLFDFLKDFKHCASIENILFYFCFAIPYLFVFNLYSISKKP